jgi:hypothetical protein
MAMPSDDLDELWRRYADAHRAVLGAGHAEATDVEVADDGTELVLNRASRFRLGRLGSRKAVDAAVRRAVAALPCLRCHSEEWPSVVPDGHDGSPFVICSSCGLVLEVALDQGTARVPWPAEQESCENCGWSAYAVVSKPLWGTASWWDDPGHDTRCPGCCRRLP